MGDSTSWIAVEGESVDAVAKALGAPWEAWAIEGRILACRRMEDSGIVARTNLLAELPRTWSFVAGDLESHVMYSAACEWRDGREIWAVVHNGQEGVDHLVVRGVPPLGWEKTRDKLLAKGKKRAGVDYAYDVPPEVGKLVVGFRIDE